MDLLCTKPKVTQYSKRLQLPHGVPNSPKRIGLGTAPAEQGGKTPCASEGGSPA